MLKGITPIESKTIRLVNEKLNFDDINDIERVINYLEEKNKCTSEGAREYLSALKSFKEDGLRQKSCIYCGEALSSDERLVCEKCFEKMDNDEEDIIAEELLKEELAAENEELSMESETLDSNENADLNENEDSDEGGNSPANAAFDEDENVDESEDENDDIDENEASDKDDNLYEPEDLDEIVDLKDKDVPKEVRKKKSEERKPLTFKDVKNAINSWFMGIVNRITGWIKFHSTILILIGIGVAVVGLITGISIFFFLRSRTTPENVVRKYRGYIKEQGYILSKEPERTADTDVYSIGPSNENLMIFRDMDGNFTGAGLLLGGSDNMSRTRQVILMSCLNESIFKNMDYTGALNVVNQISEKKGVFNYLGYECVLVIGDTSTTYYVIDETKMDESVLWDLKAQEYGNGLNEAKGNKAEAEVAKKAIDKGVDGIYFLGEGYENCNTIFGEPDSILAENTLYYKSAGVSVIYDKATGRVLYIDEDGTGTLGGISISGVYIGNSEARLIDCMKKLNVPLEYEDGGTVKAYIAYGGNKIEVTFTLIDGVVALMSAEIVG